MSNSGLVNRWGMWVCSVAPLVLVAAGATGWGESSPRRESPTVSKFTTDPEAVDRFVERFCLECHDSSVKTAGLTLDDLKSTEIAQHGNVWEKVARKLAARQMPPRAARRQRPSEDEYAAVIEVIAGEL